MISKKNLTLFTIAALVINVASLFLPDFYITQIIRLISSITYFFLLYKLANKNKYILVYFILTIITDALDFYYSTPLIISVFTIVKILAYLSIALLLLNKISFKKVSASIKLLFFLVVLINILIGYQTVSSLVMEDSFIVGIIIFLFWVISIFTASFAAIYYFNLERRSSFLIPFVFAFVFSDLSAFVAGYEYIYVFYFLEKVLYLLSFYFLGRFLLNRKELAKRANR